MRPCGGRRGKVDICPTAAHWGPGLVTWLGRLQGRRPPLPELQVRGGPAACAGHPSGLRCGGYAVILTRVLVFAGILFTQLLHWSHQEAARLALGPCRASPG